MDRIIESFGKIFSKVTFVKDSPFWGLVGMNVIYLDSDVFHLSSESSAIAKFIGFGFHEGIHLEQRALEDNFAFLIPKSHNPDNLEGGYLIEHYLWGAYNIRYWDPQIADKVIEVENWELIDGIFAKDEFDKLRKREINNPNCSGLCAQYRGKVEG